MEADVIQAVSKYLESLDILPIWFANVSRDNKGNTEKADEHFRVSLLPVPPDNSIAICGNKARYRWLVQVSIYIRDNEGPYKTAAYVDQLRDSFPANKRIYTITQLYPSYGLFPSEDLFLTDGGRIFKTVGVGAAAPAFNTDDGWYHHPVTFTIEIIE